MLISKEESLGANQGIEGIRIIGVEIEICMKWEEVEEIKNIEIMIQGTKIKGEEIIKSKEMFIEMTIGTGTHHQEEMMTGMKKMTLTEIHIDKKDTRIMDITKDQIEEEMANLVEKVRKWLLIQVETQTLTTIQIKSHQQQQE